MVRPASDGLQLALELTEFGAQLRAQRYRREHPGCDERDVRAYMQAWWRERPGAADGDAVGRPADLARFGD